MRRKPEIRSLCITILTVDPRVQRPLDRRRARAIAKQLDDLGVGIIHVSHRDTGEHSIIDGQHRTEALRIAGFPEAEVEAKVYYGLSLADEAAMFRLLNNTRKPQAIDNFKIRTIEGDATAIAITNLLARHGWKVDNPGRDGVFCAVAAMERCYTADPWAAAMAVATTTQAWGRVAASADGRLVEGICKVFARYRRAIDQDDLINQLARFPGGPRKLLGKARGLHDLRGTKVPLAVAEITTELYNTRRRSRALPPWR